MYRSLRKFKVCKYLGCQNTPTIGNGGYCWEHKEQDPGFERKEARRTAKKDEKKLMPSVSNSGIPSDLSEKFVDNAGLKYIKDLAQFFKEAAEEIAKDARCWECQQPISINDFRNSTAHILPKEFFKSIATHPLSYVVAGCRCGCHHRTHRLDTFSQMKIFPVAVLRLRQIEHLIKERHKLLGEFWRYAELKGY